MRTFSYTLTFSPYLNRLKAKNLNDFWDKVARAWPEYDVKKAVRTVY